MKQLLLVGGGHAHALVLKAWARRPPPGVQVTLVAPQAHAGYSGMVPGWLAGQWPAQDLRIDVAGLARAAGAAWVPARVQALDADARSLTLDDGRRLTYDLLSLNVGSTLHPPTVSANGRLLSLRPLERLQDDWERLLQDPWLTDDPMPLAVTAAGGGPAGVEALLAVCARLRERLPQRVLLPRLITQSERLLPGLSPKAAELALQALEAAGVQVQCGIDARRVVSQPARAPGLLLWATGAQAHPWLAQSGLAVSADGFVRVDAHLRSPSHAEVFAAGDCAQGEPALPRSGVVAVRQAPVLARNLRAALAGQPLAPYTPQARWLALLDTGQRTAIGSWGEQAWHSPWLWRCKRWIDRRFIARLRTG